MSREMDAKVAEKVMRLPVKFHTNNPNGERFYYLDMPDKHGMCPDVPHYSTDIAAAWLVVEKMLETSRIDITHEGMLWVCEVIDTEKLAIASANTAPMAICKAALKAVEE